jgi:mannosyltransferase
MFGWRRPAALAAIAGAGWLLRLLTIRKGGLFCDEAQAVFIAKSPTWAGACAFLAGEESHPPLFYAALRGWMGVWGDSDASLHALALLFGVLAIPLAWLAATSAFGRRAGWIAATLMATAPVAVQFSSLVRPYGLLACLGLSASLALRRALADGGWRPWLAYALAGSALVWAHHWGWIALGGHAVAAGIVSACARPASIRPALGWLVACGLIALAYAPWIPAFLAQSSGAGYPAAGGPPVAKAVQVAASEALGFVGPAAVPLAALLAAAAAASRWRQGEDWTPGGKVSLAVFVGAPLASIAAATVLSSRSNLIHPGAMMAIAPCLLVAASAALARLRPPTIGVAAVAGLVGLHLLSLWNDRGLIRSNAREAAAIVRADFRDGDRLVVTPQWLASSFHRYFGLDDAGRDDYPFRPFQGAITYHRLAERFADEGAFSAFVAGLLHDRPKHGRIWLITEPDLPAVDGPSGSADVLGSGDYRAIGRYRSAQIRSALESACELVRSSRDARPALETIEVLLYRW